MHTCVCMYTHICIHFLTTFTVFFTINCPFVTVCQIFYLVVHPKRLIYQWSSILSSHKPLLARKAKCASILCKMICGKQSINQLINKTGFWKNCVCNKCLRRLILTALAVGPQCQSSFSGLTKTSVLLKTKPIPPLLFFSLPSLQQTIFLFSQLLLTVGQQVCEAENLSAGGSRLMSHINKTCLEQVYIAWCQRRL